MKIASPRRWYLLATTASVGASPEQYPYWGSTLSGYQHIPSGTPPGTYIRWITITTSQTNRLCCTTDALTVILK